mgnify:CR=1 FL=1
MARCSLLLLCLLFWSLPASSNAKDDTISVIVNDWTSQIVLAHIAGTLFEKTGHKVRYSFSNTNQQWGSLMFGIDHVQVEVWEGTMADMFERAVATGRVVDAGTHDAVTREDWWYPDYVEKLCPGLPDWRALSNCSALFSADDSDTGIYIAGPWEKPEAARIRALKMKFKAQAVKHADELWVKLKQASSAGKPIVLFNWTPNWIEAIFPGKFIEFPTYSKECETNPEWGVNPNFHYDCGNPKNGWLKKAAWSGVPSRWPCAYKILTKFNFNNSTIAKLAADVDHLGLTPSQAAANWLATNKAIWQPWLSEGCKIFGIDERRHER